jgi:cytochrome c553
LLAGATVSSAAGDAAAGKAKAAVCAGCHGANGISMAPIYPNLAGQKEAYLAAQLKAFRDGSRANAIMAPMAKPLSDADIDNLAAYFSSLK